MPNPFQQRATEYMRDPEAFLSIVTPEPIGEYLKQPAADERLLDRLVIVAGTPGSGKTTMARLLQLDIIDALLRNQNTRANKPSLGILSQCKILADGKPTVAAIRLPLESEYRDYWELPYEPEIKMGLMLRLLQARAVLGWLRMLAAGAPSGLADVQIVSNDGAQAGLEAIGGPDIERIKARAAAVEQAIYGVGAALVPPVKEKLHPDAIAPYQPFNVIKMFGRRMDTEGDVQELAPLVLFDDAHSLHPDQLARLKQALMRRELLVGRWLLTRFDALSHNVLLQEEDSDREPLAPGTQPHREITSISFQGGSNAQQMRKKFRGVAVAMANRYLQQMATFNSRGIRDVASLLETAPESISTRRMQPLRREVDKKQKQLGIPQEVRTAIEKAVERYATGADSQDVDQAVQYAMQLILMHRYVRKNPQRNLFSQGDDDARAGEIPKVTGGVAHGARLHLMHNYNRAYYYGIDLVARASSENAEHFLHLTGHLVSVCETRLIRGLNAGLNSKVQHNELQSKAREIIDAWNFPYSREVRLLVDKLATQCQERSLSPNAPLDAGAGAVGIPDEEITDLLGAKNKDDYSLLAQVLKFGVAYNAFQLNRNYSQGRRGGPPWCLIELSGVVRLMHGLTLQFGGFIERKLADIEKILQESRGRE